MSIFSESACQAGANPLNKFVENAANADIGNFQKAFEQKQHGNFHSFQSIDSSVQNSFDNFTSLNNEKLVPPQSFYHHPQNQNLSAQLNQQRVHHLQPQGGWVNDFNNLSLSDHQKHPATINEHQEPRHFQPYAQKPVHSFTSRQLNAPILLNKSHATEQNVATHAFESNMAMSHIKEANKEFDSVFSEVESELITESVTPNQRTEEEEASISANNEEEKIQFAMLARKVFVTMNDTPKHVSTATSNKFKQSGFMQLMNQISNREIEISDDQKKLVDQNGVDIRSALSDPLSSLESHDILESPFESARKVTNGMVDSKSWQSEFV